MDDIMHGHIEAHCCIVVCVQSDYPKVRITINDNNQFDRWLIAYVNNVNEPRWHGYVYAGILFLAKSMQSFHDHNGIFISDKVGIQAKSMLTTAVFKKVHIQI